MKDAEEVVCLARELANAKEENIIPARLALRDALDLAEGERVVVVTEQDKGLDCTEAGNHFNWTIVNVVQA